MTDSITPRRDRGRRDSPVPRFDQDRRSGPDWGRLIAIILVSSLGSGGVSAFGVNQLSEYRIDRLEEEFRSHELVPHRATAQGIDANRLRVEDNARQIREMREEMRESFDRMEKQIEAATVRRR